MRALLMGNRRQRAPSPSFDVAAEDAAHVDLYVLAAVHCPRRPCGVGTQVKNAQGRAGVTPCAISVSPGRAGGALSAPPVAVAVHAFHFRRRQCSYTTGTPSHGHGNDVGEVVLPGRCGCSAASQPLSRRRYGQDAAKIPRRCVSCACWRLCVPRCLALRTRLRCARCGHSPWVGQAHRQQRQLCALAGREQGAPGCRPGSVGHRPDTTTRPSRARGAGLAARRGPRPASSWRKFQVQSRVQAHQACADSFYFCSAVAGNGHHFGAVQLRSQNPAHGSSRGAQPGAAALWGAAFIRDAFAGPP